MHISTKNNSVTASKNLLVVVLSPLYDMDIILIDKINNIFYAFLSREDDNPHRDLQTFTTHTTLNTEQNQLAIKLSADN